MSNVLSLLKDYKDAYNHKRKPTSPISGLQGRFIRMPPGQPYSLTDDPDRRIVFLVDSNTLNDLVGLSGYQVCMAVGWDPNYTRGKVNAGYTFALAVFPEINCKLGTWANILDAVELMYPEVARKIARHRSALSQMTPATLRQIEQAQGYTFLSVEQGKDAKKTDPRYMTIDRYKNAPDTAENARAFLYFTVHLKEQFQGDGYTRSAQGQRGVPEYIMPARPMSDLGDHLVLDIQVQIPTVATFQRPPSRGELPLPSFYDANNAASWTYQPLAQSQTSTQKGLLEHAQEWRTKYSVTTANTDTKVTTLVLIDAQLDFCNPLGSLFVAGRSGDGAIVDCATTAEFIYCNLGTITNVVPTMDTHFAYQIFFPSFWLGRDGKHPAPHTTITTDQIRSGEFKPNPAMAKWLCGGNYVWLLKYVEHYTAELEKAGKYTLYLWPPHCVLGTQGHALVGVLSEAITFHSYVRAAPNTPEIKGGHFLTENYSVLRPEVLTRHDGQPLAQKNTAFINTLLHSDRVIIAGQASSHCVMSTIDDLLSEVYAVDPNLASKCYVLQNCMSAVVVPGGKDFTPEANAALDRFRSKGMHVVDSITPMGDWPGFST